MPIPTEQTTLTPNSAHAAWRRQRHRDVASAQGNLALIETRWLPAGSTTTAEEAAAGLAASVVVTEISRRNILDGTVEAGLRFWDCEAPAISAFAGISAFDYDAAWVVEGTFTPAAEGRVIPFEHLRDNGLTRDLPVPGDISVSIDGHELTLSAFDDDGRLLLVFADTTNRSADPERSTYGNGRFLFVTGQPASTAGGADVRGVTLDFNRAFIPPCGFSAEYNCPLPPPQNRLPFPVTAGERHVVTHPSVT